MSTKTKKIPITANQLSELARQTGILLMTAAVTLGMLELPNRPNSRVILPSQPVFGWANANEEFNSNTLRRESEESNPHYISYSVAQRTPSRSGNR